MPSFAELTVFDRIIKLPQLKVKDYQFIDGFGLVLVVENIEKKPTCPRCGKTSDRLHQNHERLVRDLSHALTRCISKSKSKTIQMLPL